MPVHSFRQKNPKNKKTKLHLVFDEDSRRSFLSGFHKRKLERKKFHKQKLEDERKEELKREKRERKIAFEESMKSISFPEEKDENLTEAKVHDLENHTVTVTSVTSLDLVAEHGGIGENKVQYENEEEANSEEEEEEEEEKEKKGTVELLCFPVNEDLMTSLADRQEEIKDKKTIPPPKKKINVPEKKRRNLPKKDKSRKRENPSTIKRKKLSKMSTARKRSMGSKRTKRR